MVESSKAMNASIKNEIWSDRNFLKIDQFDLQRIAFI